MIQLLFVSMISFMCISVTFLIAMSIALIRSLSKAKHVSHEDQSVSWFRQLKIRTKLKWIIYSCIGLFVSGGGAFFVTHFSPWITFIYLAFVCFVISIFLFVSEIRKVSTSSGNVLSVRHYLSANVVGASSGVTLTFGILLDFGYLGYFLGQGIKLRSSDFTILFGFVIPGLFCLLGALLSLYSLFLQVKAIRR